jgi:aminoglycoside 2'-N-acetyltransferase I
MEVIVLPTAAKVGVAAAGIISRLVAAKPEAVLGLATGSPAFYTRLGWETWRGPTFIRRPDGDLLRTADDDGGILILRTRTTPDHLDLAAPLSAEWRPGELW